MTTIFLILLAVALAISATVLIILAKFLRREKNGAKLISAFGGVAAEFNLSISKQQQLGNRMIGFDDKSNKLLFLEILGMEQNGYLVDLERVKNFAVKKNYGPFRQSRLGKAINVSTIALELEYKNGAKPLHLPFYIKAIDPATELWNRAELVKEWESFLSTYLSRVDLKTRSMATLRTYQSQFPNSGLLIRGAYTAGQLN